MSHAAHERLARERDMLSDGGSKQPEINPVGIIEIAARLGVQRATVDQWRIRRLLPDPRWTVGGRPAWNWADVARWARETGRLK